MTTTRPRSLEITMPIPDVEARGELVGAAAFLDGSAAPGMDRPALIAWFDRHLVATGRMPRPSSIYEPGVGVAVLRTRVRATDAVFLDIIQTARERTLSSLRKLVATRPDDGFLLAALFSSRVRRSSDVSGWVACPRTTDALSDIVLSLFAVDVLRFRETYEHRLRVCAECGRVGLDGTAGSSRTSCVAHPFA